MKPDDFQAELDKNVSDKQAAENDQAEIKAITKAGIKNVEATNRNTESTAKGLKDVRGKVEVTNPDLAKSNDMNKIVDSINKMNITTFMGTTGFHDMAENIAQVHEGLQALQQKYNEQGLPDAAKSLGNVIDKIGSIVKTLTNSKVGLETKLQKTLDGLSKSIDAIEFKPTVNVQGVAPKIVQTPIDLRPVTEGLKSVEQAIKDAQSSDNKEKEKIDLTPVVNGLQTVQDAINSLRFPVSNYVLPFKDVNGRATQVQLDSSGNIPTTSGGGGGGAVTIADGADVTLGAKADAKSTATDTTPVTVMQVLKEISFMEQNPASRVVTQSTAGNLNATVFGYDGATQRALATTTGGVLNVGGTVATNVAITANPVNLGAQAVSSENSAVTTARQVQLVADLVGKLIVLPYANPENFVSGTATATDTTSTSLVAAPASGLRNYITQFTVWNSSATNTYIKIQDGSGGTTIYTLPCPTVGGSVISLPTPLRQPTTATALYFAANASANAVFISASGYKGV